MMGSRRRVVPRDKLYNQGNTKEPGERPYRGENTIIRPCQPQDAVFSKWDRVRDEIVRRLDLTYVSTIGYYRMGTKGSPQTPRPTILLSGNYTKHPNTMQKVCDTINDILKKYNLAEMAVAFSEGQFRMHSSHAESEEDEPRPKRDVEEVSGMFHPDVVRLPSLPGQSLALKENESCSGTFGGFFEITLPGLAEPKVVGITCYHVINPTMKGKGDKAKVTIMKWRAEGIKANDKMAKHLVVSHPSPLMLQQKAHSLEKEIEKLETQYYKLFEELVGCGQTLRKGDEMVYYQAKNQLSEFQALLSDIQAFDPGFGRVWMASGFRTAQAASIHNGEYRRPTNYDWAYVYFNLSYYAYIYPYCFYTMTA